MRRFAIRFVALAGSVTGVATVLLAACGGGGGSRFGNSGDDGGTTTVTLADGAVVVVGDGGGPDPILHANDASSGTVTYADGGCAGLQCQIASTCTADGGTTITGKIMDPAGANGLYNVLAYVPMYDPANPSVIPSGAGIEPIAGGVTFPANVSCDSCSYLYTGNPIAIGTSGTDGTFTITNAPSGKNIPVVVQIGKWRTHITVPAVADCQAADAGEIKLPSSADGTDPIVSMPQIAISMGGLDSIECLPYRLGIAQSEFTSGASTTGHIHIFTGGGQGGAGGAPPESYQNLWDTIGHLMAYDVTLFSCEGDETYHANPPLLEQYVNAGGRAFASHYHYAWLAGPLSDGASVAGYSANADWGPNLATWNASGAPASDGLFGATPNTTLNAGGTFAKGVALQEWLGDVGALGTSGVKSTDVAIQSPAFDAKITSADKVSQSWATFDTTNKDAVAYPSAYFSFNTPVGAVAPPDGGAAPYCGRVVFSGLHVGAAAQDTTEGMTMPSSSTCSPAPGDLSPQEKVLEFMLFDLSSCVTPDTSSPPPPVVTPPAPPK